MAFIYHIVFTLLLIINPINSQEDQACTPSDNNIITLGAKVYICAKIITTSGTYVYALGVTVDKVTALSISNIKDILTNSQNVTLALQYQNIDTTQEIVLQDISKGIYQNSISIIMQATSGVLTQLYFDAQDCSSCYSANKKTCINDQCFSAGTLLDQSNLIIYLSWIGTDILGSHFVSHTLRLKKLSLFSSGDVYSSALILTKDSSTTVL